MAKIPTHKFTKYEREKAEYKRTYNSFKAALNKQSTLGNLTSLGEQMLKDPRILRIQIEQMLADRRIAKSAATSINPYNPREYDVRSNLKQFTKAGYIAYERPNKLGTGQTTFYGREIQKLYNATVKAANGQKSYKFTTKTIVSAGPGKRGRVEDVDFIFNLSDPQSFIETANPHYLIALRIELLGEERSDVLRDYGY